jgi:16S rRNA (guanine1207-N2)-methyltransferase
MFAASILGHEIELETRPGVFSHGRLDEGTLALSEVAEPPQSVRLLDLGCGSGALGIAVALAIPGARSVLVDSSPRAVQLARKNAHRNGVGDRTAVLLGYDLSAVREGAIDLVLANPPYFGDFRIAEMFSQEAWRVLAQGGELLLVTKAPERPAETIQELFGNHEAIPRRGYTVIRGRRQG